MKTFTTSLIIVLLVSICSFSADTTNNPKPQLRSIQLAPPTTPNAQGRERIGSPFVADEDVWLVLPSEPFITDTDIEPSTTVAWLEPGPKPGTILVLSRVPKELLGKLGLRESPNLCFDLNMHLTSSGMVGASVFRHGTTFYGATMGPVRIGGLARTSLKGAKVVARTSTGAIVDRQYLMTAADPWRDVSFDLEFPPPADRATGGKVTAEDLSVLASEIEQMKARIATLRQDNVRLSRELINASNDILLQRVLASSSRKPVSVLPLTSSVPISAVVSTGPFFISGPITSSIPIPPLSVTAMPKLTLPSITPTNPLRFEAVSYGSSLTLVNQSTLPALVRVQGPTSKQVEVPPSGSQTISVAGGGYFLKIRFGTDETNFTYSKGENFSITDTFAKQSRTTITFNVAAGNYSTERIGKDEFLK